VAFVLDRIYDKFFNPRKQVKAVLEKQDIPVEQRKDFMFTEKHLAQLIEWTQQRHIHLLVITTFDSHFSEPLGNFLLNNQVPMLEATEIFKHSNPDSLPVNLIEGHWNHLGHQLIAAGIADFLKKEGW